MYENTYYDWFFCEGGGGYSTQIAFTLAEVLITFGIIGVIAAMTLPSLVGKYKEKVLVTQVKKTYSEFQNALKMYAAKNECSDITCISDLNSTSEELTMKIYKQFSGAKFCEKNNVKETLCKNVSVKANKPFNNGYGQTGNEDGFSRPYFVTASGSAIKGLQYNQCPRNVQQNIRDKNGNFVDEDNDGNPDTKTVTSYNCAIFYFDANGTQNGPNQFGADIYRINMLSSGKISLLYNLDKTLTEDKLYYTPYNVGVEMK